MEIDVAFHKWHVVAGPVGGTVTSVDGSKTFCTIPEGGQGTFYATVTKVVTSDDSITVDEVENFNCAPVKLRLLGLTGRGVDALPSGYLAAEFLESTGYVRIDTGILPENSVGLYARAGVTKNFDGYVAGVHDSTLSPAQHVGLGRYIPGCFIAPMWANGTVDYITIPSDAPFGFFETELNFLNSRKVRLTAPGLSWESADLLKNFDFTTQKTITLGWKNGLAGYPWQGQIYCVKISNGEEIICDFVPVIDKRGVPCMFDRVSKQPFYNSSAGPFIIGMDMKKARKLDNLPATGGELTVSLPWEAGVDAKVQDALAKAAENGWTVIVQYREPEVATENISIDFLESTGAQWINTALRAENISTYVKYRALSGGGGDGRGAYGVQFREVIDGTTYYNKYQAGGQIQSKGIGLNAFVIYRGTNYKAGYNDTQAGLLAEAEINMKDLYAKLTAESLGTNTRSIPSTIRDINFGILPLFAGCQGGFIGRIYSFSANYDGTPAANYIPVLDTAGAPCMYDSVSGQNFNNVGTGVFIAGFESTEKAALGLAKLPVVEAGELTVSLPAEAQDEATRVPAAIEVARQRGWTIITQYRD